MKPHLVSLETNLVHLDGINYSLGNRNVCSLAFWGLKCRNLMVAGGLREIKITADKQPLHL